MFARAFFVGFELFYLCCSALCGSFWRVFSKVSLVFLSVFVAISHSPKNSKTAVFIVFSAIWASPGQLPDSSRTAPGQLPDSSRTVPGQLPDGSRTAPGRLPDGSRTAPGRLPDSSRTAHGQLADSSQTAKNRCFSYHWGRYCVLSRCPADASGSSLWERLWESPSESR